jgi:hypothetical protein
MQFRPTSPADFPEYARGLECGLSEEEPREGARLERRTEVFRHLVGPDHGKRLVSELDRRSQIRRSAKARHG